MSRYSEEYECPRSSIESTMKLLSKKWNLQIIHELFFNKNRFVDFKQISNDLDNKTLSRSLMELQEKGIIEKRTDSPDNTPRYYLTQKGRSLNKVIYEISVFAIDNSCEIKNEDKQTIKNNIKLFLNC